MKFNLTFLVAALLCLGRFVAADSVRGDFDGSGQRDPADLDLMAVGQRVGDLKFDLNQDGRVSTADREYWIVDLANTYWGDSNFDGEWNSSDLVAVYAGGRYETGEAAGWSLGDWDGDGLFTTQDFVAGFNGFPESGLFGGYEQGPRPRGLQPVPEPTVSAGAFLSLMLFSIASVRRRP